MTNGEEKTPAAISGLLDPHLLAGVGRLSLSARTLVEGVMAGLHRSPYRGFSLEFTTHRPYVPGDEIRRIDWKAYGRLDRYFIKEYEEETNLKAWLLVDCSASMGYGRKISKQRYASLMACAVAYIMMRQRDAVGLVTYQDGVLRTLPPRSATTHLDTLARVLEETPSSGGTDTAAAIDALAAGLKRRGLIILFSDLLDDIESLTLGLKRLRHKKNDVIVFQVLDEDELELPFDRQALFVDSESPLRVQAHPADIRREYKRILGAHMDRLSHFCHANHMDYHRFSTAEPPAEALVRYLSRRETRR